MGRLPHLPLIIIDILSIGGHQNRNRNQLAHVDLATAHPKRAYCAVREFYAIYVSRLDHHNAPLMDAVRSLHLFSVNGRARIYNSAVTIRQGTRKGTDAIVLKTKPSFNWIGFSRSSP